MQAACGLAQLGRLDEFIATRRRNFRWLHNRLEQCGEFLLLPEATAESNPSWFGFPLTLREQATADRRSLLRYLDQFKIGTRLLFAGNLTRQPYFCDRQYRVAGSLANADRIACNTFWIGIYPGLSEQQLEFSARKIEQFFGLGFE